MDFSPAWDHGPIERVFDNIHVVRGTNITEFEGHVIQHSRNMVIIGQGDLVLVNTVRLDEEGLKALDALGSVKHIIRIGAFHGRDDAFYIDRYQPEFWAYEDADTPNVIAHPLNNALPIAASQLFTFESATPKEGAIFLSDHQVLITCDSIKNWTEKDPYFSDESFAHAFATGEITSARISPIWLKATGTQKADFESLLQYNFKHLISAHGDVLYDSAYQR